MKYLGTKPLSEIDLPPIIYKYRHWKDEYAKSFLKVPLIWMANPATFEDKKDCANQIEYSKLTDFEIYQFFFLNSILHNNSIDMEFHHNYAVYWLEHTPIRDNEHVKQTLKKDQEEYFDRLGVLSLTEYNAIDRMWNEYSNEYKGICIGYDTVRLFKYVGGGMQVQYQTPLPKLRPEPLMSIDERIIKRIFYKEEKYEYEKEYRATKFWKKVASKEDRAIKIDSEIIKEIIVGFALSAKEKEEVESIVKDKFPNAKLKTAKKVNGIVQIT